MKDQLRYLQNKYQLVKNLQKDINEYYKNQKIIISEAYKNGMWDEDCFDFHIDKVNIDEDAVTIHFTGVEEDGEEVECVDWMKTEDFIKYAVLIG